MANEYNIRLEVRGKSSEFGADSVVKLLCLLSTELYCLDTLTKPANTPSKDDAAAEKLLDQYRQLYKKNRKQTPIFRAGLEIDLARCYLSRMTNEKTIEWLKKERNFEASLSAVGRYFARFEQLPAAIR